jgi:hypothetical protein
LDLNYWPLALRSGAKKNSFIEIHETTKKTRKMHTIDPRQTTQWITTAADTMTAVTSKKSSPDSYLSLAVNDTSTCQYRKNPELFYNDWVLMSGNLD